MRISTFKTESEQNALYKVLTGEVEREGSLRDIADVIDPVITVESDEVIDANYAYIEDFNRYYFIRDIKTIRTGIMQITLHVDVLVTYAADILGCNAIIDKSAQLSHGSKYLNDGSYNPSSKQYTDSYAFTAPDGVTNFKDNPTHILITAGG